MLHVTTQEQLNSFAFGPVTKIQQNIFQRSTQPYSVFGMIVTGHIKCSSGRMFGYRGRS